MQDEVEIALPDFGGLIVKRRYSFYMALSLGPGSLES